jgi:hypothetical protein
MNETIVDIPGIGQVAFPATMSEQEINAAAQRLYNESQQQAQPQAPQQPVATQPTPRPPAPAQPASFMQRVAQAAQLEPSTQSMIRGAVQDPINAIRQVFGGTATRAKIAEEEKAYQAARKEAGKSGLDGFRLVGNVLSPATLAGGAAGVLALVLDLLSCCQQLHHKKNKIVSS